MKGSALAKAFAAMVTPRADVTLKEAIELVRLAFGEPTLSEKRARAGAAGGRRSADSRRAEHGTAQPRSTTRSSAEAATEPIPGASVEATPKQSQLGSSHRPASANLIHPDTSDPDPEISKEIAVVSEGSDRLERAANAPGATTPTDFESAMRETTAGRASLALQDPDVAKRCRVNDWPEVVGIIGAWCAARGYPGTFRLRPHGDDPEVKALLVLLAMGYEPEELERVARHLAQHPEFKNRALLRAVMTPDAVRIGLDEIQKLKSGPRRRAPVPTRIVEFDVPLEEQRAAAEAAQAEFRARVSGAGR